jgi:quinolinate synthase
MRQLSPGKTFIESPTAGNGATCRSCAHCPWMAMNILENLHSTLRDGVNEIQVDVEVARQALVPLERMVNFSKTLT